MRTEGPHRLLSISRHNVLPLLGLLGSFMSSRDSEVVVFDATPGIVPLRINRFEVMCLTGYVTGL